MKRIAFVLSSCALLATGLVARSWADGPKVFEGHLVGGVPNVTVRGINAGGAPWTVRNSDVELSTSGHLRIRCRGLLITSGALASGDPVPAGLVGTVGPVTMVEAALTFNGPGGGTPVTILNSDPVPLSTTGDFSLDTMVTIPAGVAQPILLIRIATAGGPGPWIAVAETDGEDD